MISTQQTRDDPRHLRLSCAPMAPHRLLDGHGVVLGNSEIMLRSSEEGDTTCLPESDRALRGAMTEDGLDGNTVRIADGQLRIQPLVNRLETLWNGITALGANDTSSKQPEATALALNDGIACGCGARIDSKNAHATRQG